MARQVATAPARERPLARSTSPGAASLAASRRVRAVGSRARSNASRPGASLAAIGGEQSASMSATGALRPQAAWRARSRRRPSANVRRRDRPRRERRRSPRPDACAPPSRKRAQTPVVGPIELLQWVVFCSSAL
jgi:hypothetical protein